MDKGRPDSSIGRWHHYLRDRYHCQLELPDSFFYKIVPLEQSFLDSDKPYGSFAALAKKKDMLTTKLLARLSSPRKCLCVDYDALLPSLTFVPGIPHSIYQTTKAKDKLPPAIEENIEKLKTTNPDWSYQLFDDHDIEHFILRYYGDPLLSYYNSNTSVNFMFRSRKAD